MSEILPEPWLRGTLTDVPPVLRAVLHALELARNDLHHFCVQLTDEELNTRPFGLPPVAFHLKHVARSLDRLLTYAEDRDLSEDQLSAIQSELTAVSTKAELFEELDAALTRSEARIRAFNLDSVNDARAVGKKRLPTTLAGLLIHVADHTQRHVGQAVTTAQLVRALRK